MADGQLERHASIALREPADSRGDPPGARGSVGPGLSLPAEPGGIAPDPVTLMQAKDALAARVAASAAACLGTVGA
jgi:hypothetical protein